MSIPCENLLVLAHLTEISRASRTSMTSEQYLMILFGIGILAIIWGLIILIGKLRLSSVKLKTEKPAQPLLDQIAEELELTAAEVQLLKKVARLHQIQPPEVLLIDPALWPPALADLPQDKAAGLALMGKLFGPEYAQSNQEAPVEASTI